MHKGPALCGLPLKIQKQNDPLLRARVGARPLDLEMDERYLGAAAVSRSSEGDFAPELKIRFGRLLNLIETETESKARKNKYITKRRGLRKRHLFIAIG